MRDELSATRKGGAHFSSVYTALGFLESASAFHAGDKSSKQTFETFATRYLVKHGTYDWRTLHEGLRSGLFHDFTIRTTLQPTPPAYALSHTIKDEEHLTKAKNGETWIKPQVFVEHVLAVLDEYENDLRQSQTLLENARRVVATRAPVQVFSPPGSPPGFTGGSTSPNNPWC